MKVTIILNDPPYGTERSYNGLRLAHSLKKNASDAEITVFLMADAVLCANPPICCAKLVGNAVWIMPRFPPSVSSTPMATWCATSSIQDGCIPSSTGLATTPRCGGSSMRGWNSA